MTTLPVIRVRQDGGVEIPSKEVAEATPEAKVRGEGALRFLDAGFAHVEAFLSRYVPTELDPIAQSGAIANTSFLIAVLSGIAVLFFYSSSVHTAYESVQAMGARPFTAGLIRSLHRYSSDAAMAFVAVHAARLFAARRFGGARWVAWVTGVALLVLLWFVGWLGYWLVWDERARQIALGTTRMLDALPIFADPPSRAFLTDEGVTSLSFFVVFFFHMLVPLAMGVALWLHITRLSRPRFLANRTLTALVAGALVVVSLVLPADTAAPAKMAVSPGRFTIDAWFAAPIAITDRLGGAAIWGILLVVGLAIVSVPWALVVARTKPKPAEVEVSKCNACTRCVSDCPYGAIQMVPRTDGRSFATQAQVDPSVCISCGICAGSCDPASIGLPSTPTLDVRKRLDTILEHARGTRTFVAFACADSAAGTLSVDSEGVSSSLPGYRVVPVPCAGWVEARLVERAFRHGAAGVLVVGCGPGACRFREGTTWTKARLDGVREPALRQKYAGPTRLLELHPTETRRLVKDAAAFVAGEPPRAKPSRAARVTVAFATVVGISLATWKVASIAYATGLPEEPQLVVSFKHAGAVADRCRPPTEAEIKNTPAHMRKKEICERTRAPVTLQVLVDGEARVDQKYAPGGVWHDGASEGIARVSLPPGKHRVSLRLDDGANTFTDERDVDLVPRHASVVLFDKSTGFRWPLRRRDARHLRLARSAAP